MSATSCSVKPEDRINVGDAGGKLAIVHANVDRRVQRRRRVPGSKRGCARSASQDGHALQLLLPRPGVHTRNGRICAIFAGIGVAEQHKDVSDLWDRSDAHWECTSPRNVGRVEDFGDRGARGQRLADMREAGRDYSGDRRKTPSPPKMALTSSRRPRAV